MDEFEMLMAEIKQCRECEELFGFTPHPIVYGNNNAKIVQISQAPSKDVHITNKPFNDASGRKLKYDWYQISDEEFYNPENFYITSIGHCFPGKNRLHGDKLPPNKCAKKWLNKEVNLVNNKLYILIGRKSAEFFFKGENYNDLIFKDSYINGIKTIVLPHPSPMNARWFKEHPTFEERLKEIRFIIRNIIGDKDS